MTPGLTGSVEAKHGGIPCSLSFPPPQSHLPFYVSMYEIENFAYMFFWERGLESLRSNPVSHVSVYMYVCMGVGEGVCMWGGGRGVSVGWGKGCVCGVG